MTQSEFIERDFTSYLKEQRGLAATTVENYAAGARTFLGTRFGSAGCCTLCTILRHIADTDDPLRSSDERGR